MANVLGSAVLELAVDTRQYDQGLRDAERSAEQSTSRIGGLFSGLGKTAALGIAGATAAVGGLTAAGYAIGSTFDDVYDAIAVGTGAAGDALDGLKDDFRAVVADVPTDFGRAADAITTLNTLTGATGETLQDLTSNVLEASRLLGEDASSNAAAFGRVMEQWQVPAEEGAALTDHLFRLTQDYGVSLGGINQSLSAYGSIMQNAGFSVGETAELMARMNAAGLSWSRISPGLNQAFRNWAAAGVEPREEFEKIIGAMRDAESETEALTIATEVFGAQGAQRLTTAVRTGVFDMEDFGAALGDTTGLILEMADETSDAAESWQLFKNQALLAVEPLATQIFDLAGNLLSWLLPAIASVFPVFTDWLIRAADAVSGPLVSGVETARDLFQRFVDGPLLWVVDQLGMLLGLDPGEWGNAWEGGLLIVENVFGLARDAVTTFLDALSGEWEDADGIHGLHSAVGNFGTLLRDDIIPAVTTFGETALRIIQDDVLPVLSRVADYIRDPLLPAITELVGSAWDAFKEDVLPVLETVAGIIKDDLFPAAKDFAGLVWPRLEDVFGWLLNNKEVLAAVGIAWGTFVATTQAFAAIRGIQAAWTAMSTGVRGLNLALLSPPGIALLLAGIATAIFLIWQNWDEIQPKLAAGWEWMKRTAGDLKDAVVGFFTDLWEGVKDRVDRLRTWLSETWDGITTKASDTWDGITSTVTGFAGDIRDGVTGAIETARDTLSGIWDTVKTKATTIWDDIKAHITDTKDAMIDALKAPFEWLRDNVGAIMRTAGNNIIGMLNNIIERSANFAGKFAGIINDIADAIGMGRILPETYDFTKIPELAKGGRIIAPGLAIVGEEGPELVELPAGARVIPHDASMQALAGVDGPMNEMGAALGVGGPFDWGRDVASGVIERVKDVGSSVLDVITAGPRAIFDRLTTGLSFELPGVFSQVGVELFSRIKDGAFEFVKGLFERVQEEVSTMFGGAPIELGGWFSPARGVLTQGFGMTAFAQSSGWYGPAGHTGIDIAAGRGSPIWAANDGVVAAAIHSAVGYGNHIILNHAENLQTLYGHLERILVRVGDLVSGGQQIGTMDSTGASTGDHLHFELRRGGVPINPTGIVPFADGGIVTEPTIGLVGEAGPEAIIPLSNLRRIGERWIPKEFAVVATDDASGGIGGMFGRVVEQVTKQAIQKILDEEGTSAWTAGLADLFSGNLLRQLEDALSEVEAFIAFGVAKGWPAAVLEALEGERAAIASQIERVMRDLGVAFEAGLLDPQLALDLGLATVELLDEAVLSRIAGMIDDMEDAGASLLNPILNALQAGTIEIASAAELLPESVIPQLEMLERRLTVDLATALLTGTDPTGIEANIRVIMELLDALGKKVEEAANEAGGRSSEPPQLGQYVEGKGWYVGGGYSNVAPKTTSYRAYADGGIIREPVVGLGLRTGDGYLIGEAGPEAVVPLSGGPGGTMSRIEVRVPVVLDGREIAEAVAPLTVDWIDRRIWQERT